MPLCTFHPFSDFPSNSLIQSPADAAAAASMNDNTSLVIITCIVYRIGLPYTLFLIPLKLTRRQMSATLAPAFLSASQPERPNLLMILSDDHSAEFLGASGNPLIQTPNLDRFASQGIRCTRMFTAAPQCVPSRAAFLTGRSPVAARMGRFTAPLPADVRAFAEDLREAGYFTGVCRRGAPNRYFGKASPKFPRI